MAYFPDRTSDREVVGIAAERRLGVFPMLSSQIEAQVELEKYSENGTDLYVVSSRRTLGAQAVANMIQAPFREEQPLGWSHVQAGLRHLTYRPKYLEAANKAELDGRWPLLSQGSWQLAIAMKDSHDYRDTSARIPVFSYGDAARYAAHRLRDLSTAEFQQLLNAALGTDIDVRHMRNMLKNRHHRPLEKDQTPLEKLLSDLESEMNREGYDTDDNEELLNELQATELNDTTEALRQRLFERFETLISEQDYFDGAEPDPDDAVYIHKGDIPPSLPPNHKYTKVVVGDEVLTSPDERGDKTRRIIFRSPAVAKVVRPALLWRRQADGSRQFALDLVPPYADTLRDQFCYMSPLLGAAALAARYNFTVDYQLELNARMNTVYPYADRLSPHQRAGLWPLVMTANENELLYNPFVDAIETELDG